MSVQLDAKALYEKQVDCIVRDDRDTQLTLYADDLLYEFPFATDRPQRIEGRDAFHQVMAPIWERARKMGARIVGHKYEMHETADPDFIIAELMFHVEYDGNRIDVPFVQFFWTSGRKIVAVREYSNPRVRAELDEKK